MSESSTWTVTGMTCGHCVASVTEEVSASPASAKCRSTCRPGAVVVTSEAPLDPAAVAAAVEEAGYALA